MQAETLNCPMCGAAVSSDSAQCLYCSARLATIACPSCFGMMFLGSRHCQRCGARAARVEDDAEAVASRQCPRCRVALGRVAIGATTLHECARCAGLWVDVAAFEQICADREQQSAVLGVAATVHEVESKGESHVRYVPCPQCGQLMNRVNFARCSGVVVDVCKGHGTWFDLDELQRIVEFIRAGGLDAARTREKMQLAEERERLRQEQLAATHIERPLMTNDDDNHPGVVAAASSLLKFLLD
jgi:Zn-finger nucleic acid-binding protein